MSKYNTIVFRLFPLLFTDKREHDRYIKFPEKKKLMVYIDGYHTSDIFFNISYVSSKH